jgi:hypothetical protein
LVGGDERYRTGFKVSKCKMKKKNFFAETVQSKVVFIRLGIYPFVNKARGVGRPHKFSHFMLSQLNVHSFEFIIRASLKEVFLYFFLKIK